MNLVKPTSWQAAEDAERIWVRWVKPDVLLTGDKTETWREGRSGKKDKHGLPVTMVDTAAQILVSNLDALRIQGRDKRRGFKYGF